jgi:Arc/MetJ-type ribon-helix-helix transcriptional regulator
MSNSSEKDNISSALGHLSDTLVEEKERLNEEVAQAVKDGEYDSATAMIQFAQRLLGFQGEVEALIEKWEKLEDVRGNTIPQDQHTIRSRVFQSKPPARAPQAQRSNYKGITDSTVHCFHILDVIEEMGGVAKNQDVTAAVNKRVKMLYPKFKEARALMAHQGWTTRNGSNHTLEISDKGTRWLQSQKAQIADPAGAQEAVMPKPQDVRPTPAVEDESGPFI